MPELPEVEFGRRLAESVATDRVIERAACADDDLVYAGVTPPAFAAALRGRRVVAVHRRGKHLFFELDRGPHPLFHFGMTGAFRAPNVTPLPLSSSAHRPDPSWPPRFAKLRLFFGDGGELAFTDPRRLGRIRLREAPLDEPPISELGFDPYLDLPSAAAFRARVRARRGNLKALLLDQHFAAGVGNWIADEVLYAARLSPHRDVSTLRPAEIERLRRALAHVITTAVDVSADKARFPREWLFHARWGRKRATHTARGEPIEYATVNGRTTAWVPSVQR